RAFPSLLAMITKPSKGRRSCTTRCTRPSAGARPMDGDHDRRATTHADPSDRKEGQVLMKTTRAVLLLLLTLLMARKVAADEPDAALIAKITGLTPDVKNGIAKVSVPRGDLGMVIDGAEMQPFQRLTSL